MRFRIAGSSAHASWPAPNALPAASPARNSRRSILESGIIIILTELRKIMVKIEKYSVGVGDRFAHQARAQLRACLLAADAGVDVIPVWNKSNREHMIIGSEPSSL